MMVVVLMMMMMKMKTMITLIIILMFSSNLTLVLFHTLNSKLTNIDKSRPSRSFFWLSRGNRGVTEQWRDPRPCVRWPMDIRGAVVSRGQTPAVGEARKNMKHLEPNLENLPLYLPLHPRTMMGFSSVEESSARCRARLGAKPWPPCPFQGAIQMIPKWTESRFLGLWHVMNVFMTCYEYELWDRGTVFARVWIGQLVVYKPIEQICGMVPMRKRIQGWNGEHVINQRDNALCDTDL